MEFVLATKNAHKVEELRRILCESVETDGQTGEVSGGNLSLRAHTGASPKEDGTSFEENALKKARAVCAQTGLPAIADDSGIGVEILGWAPGIFSARWAGARSSDTENLQLLLEQLADIEHPHRAAAFFCAAALVLPDGREFVRTGVWRGTLLHEARGKNGFGYDPIFQPEGYTCSAAELSAAQKDSISHRFRAFSALKEDIETVLRDFTGKL